MRGAPAFIAPTVLRQGDHRTRCRASGPHPQLGLCLRKFTAGRSRSAQRETRHREDTMKHWKSILAAGVLAVSGAAGGQAAELIVLTGMGSFSGVRDVAAGFEKASGHK